MRGADEVGRKFASSAGLPPVVLSAPVSSSGFPLGPNFRQGVAAY